MNGQVLEAAAGSAWLARPAVLGASRLQRLALSQCERPAGLCGAPARAEKHEQRRSVPALVAGARSRHQQQDDTGEEPSGADRGWPDSGHAQRRCDARRSALADSLSDHRSTGLRSASQARRGSQGHQRMESDCHAGDGKASNKAGRGRCKGRGQENKNPGSEIDPHRVRNWPGQPFNRVRKWTMASRTGSKTDPGKKYGIVRKASNGAGFIVKADFPRLKSHGSKTGLLYITANPVRERSAFRAAVDHAETGEKPPAAHWLKNGAHLFTVKRYVDGICHVGDAS